MGMTFFHYNKYYINNKPINYDFLLDEITRKKYIALHEKVETQEFNYYRKQFKTDNSNKRVSDIRDSDWKTELKDFLFNKGLTNTQANVIAAKAFGSVQNLDTEEGLEQFRSNLIDLINEKVNVVGQLSLFTDEGIINTIEKVYKNMKTRTGTGSLKITVGPRKGYSMTGYGRSSIEGWIIEIAQGLINPQKKSTNISYTAPILLLLQDHNFACLKLEVKYNIETASVCLGP